ncbi:MAG: OmpA family protein [Actinomycetota bacterium]|nr:OmpA family protein [Actinomycetota bacterium]
MACRSSSNGCSVANAVRTDEPSTSARRSAPAALASADPGERDPDEPVETDAGQAAPEVDSTPSTTAPGPDLALVVAQLQEALATAGFPDLIVVVDGERHGDAVVRVTGAVPDEAARRVALESLTEAATAAGLPRIVDNIVLGEQASAATLNVQVSRSRATVSGVVAQWGDLQPLLDGLGQVYRPEQIDVSGVRVDAKALELSFFDVVGEVFDAVLADRLTTVLTAALSTVPSANIEVATVEQARVEVALGEILAAAPLQFESGSDEIVDSAEETLVAIAEALAAFPAAVLEVGGHTDSQGRDEQNQDLSRRRAESVVARLTELGVPNELSAIGYGELGPLVIPEATDDDRALNRRIEFRLI